MLHELLAETASQSEKVLIWTLILTSVGGFVTSIIALIKGQLDRVQDRLDAESKAKILLEAGQKREERINAKIDENTEVNKTALEVSNGHNAKIKAALETVADLTDTVKAAVVKKED